MQTAAWDWVWSSSHYAVRHLHVYASLSPSHSLLPSHLVSPRRRLLNTRLQGAHAYTHFSWWQMASQQSVPTAAVAHHPIRSVPKTHTHTHTHIHKAPVSPLITPSHHRHNNNSLFASHNTAAQEPLCWNTCALNVLSHTHTFCQLWCVLQRPGSLHSWAEILREGLGVKERPLMSVKERDAPTMLESARGRRC